MIIAVLREYLIFLKKISLAVLILMKFLKIADLVLIWVVLVVVYSMAFFIEEISMKNVVMI